MATPSEKLALSLEVLKKLQGEKNEIAIPSSALSRTHRERLMKKGFIKPVLKGWYISVNPQEQSGETTYWYMSYWQFCARYLTEKYGEKYYISAEQSLLIHAGNTTVPPQMIVKSPKASNTKLDLLHNTSLYLLKSPLRKGLRIEEFNGIRILSKAASLVYSTATIFVKNPIEVRTVLALITDASEILSLLLEGEHSVVAGRIAGAFRNIGKEKIANEIVKTMAAADFKVREVDPFESSTSIALNTREKTPYGYRIRLLWSEMRAIVMKNFPESPHLTKDNKQYLASIADIYATDAYHSLSIERYFVSAKLIEKVKSGAWDLAQEEDKKHRDAMAARGYWQATQLVKKSIEKILKGENSGKVFADDHADWYRELFAPSVAVGILKPVDLAGYRMNQVYISNSMHTPFTRDGLRDAMFAFLELLEKEEDARVRVVLGHFIFVYIHPYMDGNGRMARFLMNVMLASGGYPWTVIPVEERDRYIAALEEASVNHNIKPFTIFIAELVQQSIDGKPVAKLVE